MGPMRSCAIRSTWASCSSPPERCSPTPPPPRSASPPASPPAWRGRSPPRSARSAAPAVTPGRATRPTSRRSFPASAAGGGDQGTASVLVGGEHAGEPVEGEAVDQASVLLPEQARQLVPCPLHRVDVQHLV